MRRFILTFAGIFVLIFGMIWEGTARFNSYFIDPEAGMTKAHSAMLARCDVGQVLILGDSTANADYLPELIGPNVRILALSGARPIESYYILHQALRCPHKPKAVVFAYTPFKLTDIVNFDDYVFWDRAIGWHVLSQNDAENVRMNLRHLGDQKLMGPRTLLDLDAHLKIFLYSHFFPPYYFPSFLGYINTVARYYKHKSGGKDIGFRHREWSYLYHETLEANGHHSYGQEAANMRKDLETSLPDYNISKISDYYLRKAIRELHDQNIEAYFSPPPRNAFSVSSYNPKIALYYNAYLKTLAQNEGLHLLPDRFPVLPPQAFGDETHLNVHGDFWQSVMTRREMANHDARMLVYRDDALQPHDLFDNKSIRLLEWRKRQPNVASTFIRAPEVFPPTLAYSMPKAMVMHYTVPAGAPPEASLTLPSSKIKAILTPGRTYIASVFVRNDTAKIVTWRLLLQGYYDGGISWDFANRKILYHGQATPLNSGVELCSDDWIRLWARGTISAAPTSSPDMALQTDNSGKEAIYAYGPSLEQAFNSHNDCLMTPTTTKQ